MVEDSAAPRPKERDRETLAERERRRRPRRLCLPRYYRVRRRS